MALAFNKQDSAIIEDIIPQMFSQQQQYKMYQKNQENMAHSQRGKNNLTEINPEEFQTLELLVKDVKSAVLHMFNELKENLDKKTKGNQENNVCTK